MNEEKISKFLSYILRHKPESIGLTIDVEGWVNIDALILSAASIGISLDKRLIQIIVANNDKKRFSISQDGAYIRAVQGHSTKAVSLDYSIKIPPSVLYHGTATRFLDSIRAEGLLAGTRHHVHLSENIQTAITVGRRYGKPVVLEIKALQMHQQGFNFFLADNGTWLTAHVPAPFIHE